MPPQLIWTRRAQDRSPPESKRISSTEHTIDDRARGEMDTMVETPKPDEELDPDFEDLWTARESPQSWIPLFHRIQELPLSIYSTTQPMKDSHFIAGPYWAS